jgi:1-acyl-sn-glycerol-3-phosphate acyltransferase
VLYWFIHVLLGPLVRAFHNPHVEGLEHVPEHGPAILASNHLSFSDSIFLPLALPRRIWFPAKMEYFTKPGLKGFLSKAFFKGTGQIPIDRSGGNASENALKAGLDVLQRGDLFGIYPEGTRSPDGRLHKGKTGVARLALEGRVPVIPVAMIDTDKFQPTGQLIPNLAPVGIRFGAPLDFSRYEGMANDRAVLRAITDEIMYELASLSGREYVDEYAATRKAAIAAKAEQLVAKGTAKAEEIVAAGRGRVEGVVAATKERTQHRLESRSSGGGGGRDRAAPGVEAQLEPTAQPGPAAVPNQPSADPSAPIRHTDRSGPDSRDA